MLNVEGLAGFDPAHPRRACAREVVRVNGIAASPVFQFLKRLAVIFQDLRDEEFDLTCRCHYRDKARNVVDDQAKILLVLPKCTFLRLLATLVPGLRC